MADAPHSPRLRATVAALSAAQGLIFVWGALVLPWHLDQVFTVLLLAAAAIHLAAAVFAVGLPRRFSAAWRAQAVAGLALLAYLGWVLGSSASYMFGVYGNLGAGLGAALLAVFAPVALLTLPTSLWALAATGGIRTRAGQAAVAVLVLAAGVEALRWPAVGRGEALVAPAEVDRFEVALGSVTASAAVTVPGSLMTSAPATCDAQARLRVVATFRAGEVVGPVTRCVSGDDPEGAARALASLLAAERSGPEVKVDLLTRSQSLDTIAPLAGPFALRPGLDGVCAGARCLMPWQMVALDQFNAFRPLDFIPDLRLGVDPDDVRRRLDAPPADGQTLSGLSRIATASFVRSAAGRWRRFERFRPARSAEEPGAFARAEAAAGSYVHRAQGGDGRFLYKVHPFTGAVEHGSFSIARQAGTTLALCELGAEGSRTRAVAARSLTMLSRLAHASPRDAGVAALTWPAGRPLGQERLGPNALALVAFLTCRERLGNLGFDPLVGRLGELMLRLLDAQGRFRPRFDMATAEPVEGTFGLYADGQGVYALVLLTRLAETWPGSLPREAEVYRDAALRAMRFYGEDYWDLPARDFFFIEENWHCLAARAALETLRVDAYERFCLDYARFKARLVFTTEDGLTPDISGGFTFGNVTAPYNTPTAGFGEAAAAALAVAEVRGEALPDVKASLRAALGFLAHTQWSEIACFACTDRIDVRGAFSESLASPLVRIDYVQHAWAALGHGRRALGLDGAEASIGASFSGDGRASSGG